jgi:hypothetical protein
VRISPIHDAKNSSGTGVVDNARPPKQPSGLDGQTKLLLVLTFILFVLLVATHR